MKFSCKTSDLLQGLHLVSRAISGQQTLPILGNILLQVEGKRCTLSATDLELSIITSFEANVENEGSITVPAKAILNFAQYNSDAEVLLETTEGTQLKCTSTHAKTVLSGESASEYPTIAAVDRDTSFSLEGGPLLRALNMVTFASAKSTLRPVLSGVLLQGGDKKLVLVSTDSYRLSEYTMDVDSLTEEVSCIVPTKVLEEVKSVVGAKKTDDKEEKEDINEALNTGVEVVLSAQQIEIRFGNTRLLSRLIDGKFPDYKQIIPKDISSKATLSVRDLTTVTKRMHYFAKEVNNSLTFKLSSSSVHISTPETQSGRDEADLEIALTGDENTIALSSAYLLDFLNHISDDSVEMHMVDSQHPAVFYPSSDEPILHLVMPLRLQE